MPSTCQTMHSCFFGHSYWILSKPTKWRPLLTCCWQENAHKHSHTAERGTAGSWVLCFHPKRVAVNNYFYTFWLFKSWSLKKKKLPWFRGKKKPWNAVGPGLNPPRTRNVLIWALPLLRMHAGPAVTLAFLENPKVTPRTSGRVVHILPYAYRPPHSSGSLTLAAFPSQGRKHKTYFFNGTK